MADICQNGSALAPGMCSNHGVCVAGRCVCAEGWMGSSDLWNFEGADCQVNRIVDRVFWAILIVFWLVLWKDYYLALKLTRGNFENLRNRKAKNAGKVISPWRYPPFLTLVPGLLIICPAFLSIGIIRLATTRVFGYDLFLTFLLIIAVNGMFISAHFTQTNMVRTLISNVTRDPTMERVLVIHDRLWLVSTSLNVIATASPLLVLLFGPYTKDIFIDTPGGLTAESKQAALHSIVVFRNMASMIYTIMLWLTAEVVVIQTTKLADSIAQLNVAESPSKKKQTQQQQQDRPISVRGLLLHSSSSNNAGSIRDLNPQPSSPRPISQVPSVASSSPANKMAILLSHLREASKTARKKAIVAAMLYILFALPYFVGVQNYNYAIIYILIATGNATPARYYLAARDKSAITADPNGSSEPHGLSVTTSEKQNQNVLTVMSPSHLEPNSELLTSNQPGTTVESSFAE